jgi:30S ribosomal protein 3|tara:strand:- start:677 stop:976 length:300 start_codon:yes stop_codon:yes gene_type:complete
MKLELSILWLDNSLGIAVNEIKSNREVSLTQYYFWPRNNAWEQIKLELESKNWIRQQEKIKILNNISKIMNSWKIRKDKSSLMEVIDESNCKVKLTGTY